MIVRLAKKPINAKPLSSKHEQYNLFVISSNPETHPGGKKVSKILTLFKTKSFSFSRLCSTNDGEIDRVNSIFAVLSSHTCGILSS